MKTKIQITGDKENITFWMNYDLSVCAISVLGVLVDGALFIHSFKR